MAEIVGPFVGLFAALVMVATPILAVVAAFVGPYLAFSLVSNVRRTRQQLERLNDILEQRLSLDSVRAPRV